MGSRKVGHDFVTEQKQNLLISQSRIKGSGTLEIIQSISFHWIIFESIQFHLFYYSKSSEHWHPNFMLKILIIKYTGTKLWIQLLRRHTQLSVVGLLQDRE